MVWNSVLATQEEVWWQMFLSCYCNEELDSIKCQQPKHCVDDNFGNLLLRSLGLLFLEIGDDAEGALVAVPVLPKKKTSTTERY